MSDRERFELKPGERVVVLDDNDEEQERVVKYEPWQLGHGEWVLGLKGICGGYLLSRVVRRVA